MKVVSSNVHSVQTMEFPKEVQDRVAAAAEHRRAHPSVPRGRAVPATAAPVPNQIAAAPKAQAKTPARPAMAAMPQNVVSNPAIDPNLMASMQGLGQPGVYHNPMNPAHAAAARANPGVQYGMIEDSVPLEAPAAPAAPEWYETPRPIAADVTQPVIRNPQPGFVVPMADKDGTSVALPSRFAYYGFKDLYVVPFRNGHLAKLQRANTEGNLQPVVEVVSSVIYTSTPGYQNLAFQLTMPDFFFVLYWLRLNSFTKASFTHKTKCTNPDHVQAVKDGKMAEDTLQIKRIVDKTTLITRELEEIPDPEVFNFGPDSDLVFNPPRMQDVLEFLDHPFMQDPNTRVEFSYLAQQASHVQSSKEYLSLERRIDMVENFDLDTVQLLKQFEKAMKSYGVEESIMVTCKGCGASRKSTISLDASAFLSFD